MPKKKGSKSEKLNLNGETRRQIEYLEALKHVSKVSVCGFDKVSSHLEVGCHMDPKAENGYTRGTNGIPLIIVDKRKTGGLRVVVYTEPGYYDPVKKQVSNYIWDGCGDGRITRDSEVLHHLSNIDSLAEVAGRKMGNITETKEELPSGIHDIVRNNGNVDCTVVGSNPGFAIECRIKASYGASEDLEWIMENYKEYFTG